MAERSTSPGALVACIVVVVGLVFAATESILRYLAWPAPIVSGWRATTTGGPLNQAGWRGQKSQHLPSDFVVVLTGGDEVECVDCPPDETLDAMLERALRRYNPDARVVTLGSRGYAQDQELLALLEYLRRDRADLIIDRAHIARDVPGNTFRTGSLRPGVETWKPTFTLRGRTLVGPTEEIGEPVFDWKLMTLLVAPFVPPGGLWNWSLPKASPGAAEPPPGVETRTHVDDVLEEQRSPWSIWLTPRPARVAYGIDLTRALLRRMRDLATLRGARFEILATEEPHSDAPVALEHGGHWFLASPKSRDAAIAAVTEGFDVISAGAALQASTSPDAERRMMAFLADTLNQRGLLTPPARSGH